MRRVTGVGLADVNPAIGGICLIDLRLPRSDPPRGVRAKRSPVPRQCMPRGPGGRVPGRRRTSRGLGDGSLAGCGAVRSPTTMKDVAREARTLDADRVEGGLQLGLVRGRRAGACRHQQDLAPPVHVDDVHACALAGKSTKYLSAGLLFQAWRPMTSSSAKRHFARSRLGGTSRSIRVAGYPAKVLDTGVPLVGPG